MKYKKTGFFIIVLSVIAFFGYRYYSTTYQSQTGYAQILMTPKKEKAVDDSGAPIKDNNGTQLDAYSYTFYFITEKGEKRTLTYELTGVDVHPYPEGSYIRAEVSKKRITYGPTLISKNELPNKIKNTLN